MSKLEQVPDDVVLGPAVVVVVVPEASVVITEVLEVEIPAFLPVVVKVVDADFRLDFIPIPRY